MLLLLELHGDLPDHFPNNERRLYIFGCPRKPCNRKPGSIRAYRATRKVSLPGLPLPQPQKEEKKKQPEPQPKPKPEPVAPPKPKIDLGASLFGATVLTSSVSANSNPFSVTPGSSTAVAGANPFAMPKRATPAGPAPAPAAQSQSSTTTSTCALAESFADKVRISSPAPASASGTATKQTPESTGVQASWPAQSAFPAPYKKYYLDAEYETMSRPSTPTIPENVIVEPMEEDSAGGEGNVELKDTFESEMDKAFMKFSMRLAHNPEQVLRYEYRGIPLLSSYADQVGKRLHPEHSAGHVTTTGGGSMPPCEYCGAPRVFEVQLVPHAISMLEDGREGVGLGEGDAGMEWGTIILGVCGQDCAPEKIGQLGWREEWAGVQWEEIK
jgi:pre-rRNA-processing protein TSR4